MSDHNEPPLDDAPEGPADGPAAGSADGSVDRSADGSADGSAGDTTEPLGSVGEEAAKLFAALSDLARERGSDLGETAASTATHVSDALRDAGDHIGHGEDCRYCPVCQTIRVVRETSPEVKAHLAVAASSLMQAAAGVLATHVPEGQQDESPVEHIDLDDPEDWEDDT